MEEDKETVYISTFYNPELFWFINDQDIPDRQRLTDKINDYDRFELLQTFVLGQLVMVKFDSIWVRAEVIKVIDNGISKKEHVCWLYDYGIFCVVPNDIYQLPVELLECPTYIKKGMFYGLMPVVNEHHITSANSATVQTPSWAPNIHEIINKLLSETDRLLTFSRHYEYKGYEVGFLFLIHENGEKQNLAELLISCGLVNYDEKEFHAKLFAEQPEAAVDSMYVVYTSIMECQIRNNNAKSPIRYGRGRLRTIAQKSEAVYSPGQGQRCQTILPDELFVDAESSDDVASFTTCSSDPDREFACRETSIDSLRTLVIQPDQQHVDQICIQAVDEPEPNSRQVHENRDEQNTTTSTDDIKQHDDETHAVEEQQNMITENENKDVVTSFEIIEKNEYPEDMIEQCSQDNETSNCFEMVKETLDAKHADHLHDDQMNIQPADEQNTIKEIEIKDVSSLHEIIEDKEKPENMIEQCSQDIEYCNNSEMIQKTPDSDITPISHAKRVDKDVLVPKELIEDNEIPELIECIPDQDKAQYNNSGDAPSCQNAEYVELDHEISLKDADDNMHNKKEDISRKLLIQDNEGLVFSFPSTNIGKKNLDGLFPISKGHGVNRDVESEPASDTSYRYKGRGLSSFDRIFPLCNRPKVGSDEEYLAGAKITDPIIVWLKPKIPKSMVQFQSDVKRDGVFPFKCFPAGATLPHISSSNDVIRKVPKQAVSLSTIVEQNLRNEIDPTKLKCVSKTLYYYSFKDDAFKRQDEEYIAQVNAMIDQQNACSTQYQEEKMVDAENVIHTTNYEHPEALKEVYDAPGENSSTQEYLNLECEKNLNAVSDQTNLSVQNSKSIQKLYISQEPPKPLRRPNSTTPKSTLNLFKTKETYVKLETQYKIHKTDDYWNTLPTPRLLVHGLHVPLGTTSSDALALDAEVQQKLVYLNCSVPNYLQFYTWPAILRSENVIVINEPNTGKTMSYLPAICSLVNQYPNEECNADFLFGPRAIIFCPGSQVAENICKLVNILLNAERKAVLLLPPFGEVEVAELESGVDILICTPPIFVGIFKAKLIHLHRVVHVVIENASDTLEIFHHDMDVTFNLFQRKLHLVSEAMQLIVISEEYTTDIELLAQQLLRVPLVCIGSYLEAAFYGHVETRVKFTGSVIKQFQVIDLLSDQSSRFKTIIISNDMEESNLMEEYLNTHGYNYLVLNERSSENDIISARRTWAQSIVGRYPVLVCTNNILRNSLTINDASFVIQLNVPTTWDELMYLYSSFTNNYCSPLLTTKNEKYLRLRAYIFLEETNLNLVPRLVVNLLRKGLKITTNVFNKYLEITSGIELKKLKHCTKICENVMIFGICKKQISCPYRHRPSPEVDVLKALPTYNYIKMDLLYVASVSSFYVRLIEYKDNLGKIHTVYDRNSEIDERLQIDCASRTIAFDVRIGSIAAVEETKNQFRRCKVVQLETKSFLNHVMQVHVQELDTGVETIVSTNKLYVISEDLKRIPPQVIKVYIAGMVPPDHDVIWSEVCFDKMTYTMSRCHPRFTGKVALQLGSVVIVENLCQKNAPPNKLLIPSIKEFLLREQLADENAMSLQILYGLCIEHGIPVPDNQEPRNN